MLLSDKQTDELRDRWTQPNPCSLSMEDDTLHALIAQLCNHYVTHTDQLFNLEFQFESVFNLEFQPKFGIQLGIPISMEINLGESSANPHIPQVIHSR